MASTQKSFPLTFTQLIHYNSYSLVNAHYNFSNEFGLANFIRGLYWYFFFIAKHINNASTLLL